jgi:hypothetical protein
VSDGTTGEEPPTAGPEKLLAEALRAQAVRARLPDPAARAEPEPRLLAGSGDGLLAGHPPDEFEPPTSAIPADGLWRPPVRDTPPTTRLTTQRAGRRAAPLPVGWIVLLALLLGLAAGAVVGLVSVV